MDLIGKKFGRLTVIKKAPDRPNKRRHYWTCHCECGGKRTTDTQSLKSGKTRSCGCLLKDAGERRVHDLTGMQFGRLTAIKRSERRNKQGRRRHWECQCECKNIVEIERTALILGATRSCGCLPKDLYQEHGKRLVETNKKHEKEVGARICTLTTKTRTDNRSGVKGVSIKQYKKSTKYIARITIKGKTIPLGTFDTLEEAATARKQAEEKYHQPFLNTYKELKDK
ncbi:hypothetical protein NSQ26_04790 [Bacillus sp. FSL W7-1360]